MEAAANYGSGCALPSLSLGPADPLAPSTIADLISARRATMREVRQREASLEMAKQSLQRASAALVDARDADQRVAERIESHLLRQLAGELPLDPDPLARPRGFDPNGEG